MKSGFLTALVLCLALAGSVQSLEGTSVDTNEIAIDTTVVVPWCRVGVDQLTVDNGQLYDTLDLYFETEGIELAGYVLKLGLASHLLGVIEILPGEIIDSCGWDMFHANRITPRPETPQISELWQITALAQIGMGEEAPVCFSFERSVSLARLVVSSLHVPIAPDTSISIFFYWELCRDNVLSDREGASIIVSDTVISSFPVAFETAVDQFPTCHGTPPECISLTAFHAPRRMVEFQNGGVEFRLRVEPDKADSGSSEE